MGLRAGARNACIQNRTRAARMKRWNSASRTKARACVIMVAPSGVLAQGLAHLDRAVAGGAHGVDEVLLHAGSVEDADRGLGRAALRGHLGSQGRRLLAALDGELGRADEGPEGE